MLPFWVVYGNYNTISNQFMTKKEAEDVAIQLAREYGQGNVFVGQ